MKVAIVSGSRISADVLMALLHSTYNSGDIELLNAMVDDLKPNEEALGNYIKSLEPLWDEAATEYHSFKCNANHRTKGNHKHPHYHKGRW